MTTPPASGTAASRDAPHPAASWRVVFWLIAATSAVLLFGGLGRSDFYNPDEPREAEMAREMLVSGDYVVPHLNGEPFLEKPPLFYWLVISAYRLAGGPGEAAARAVPALCGLLTVLVTLSLARTIIGERAAPLAALVLLTAFEFFWISRRCMIDMPLTLLVACACAALYHGIVIGGDRRIAWLAAGYLLTGLAVLMKGIIGAGIPGLAAAAWIASRRDWRGIWRHGLFPGAVVALAPVTAWVLLLHRRLGDAAVREFVLVNNIMRFTGGASKGHDQPFHYYLPTLLADLAPWSIVLPFAIVAAFKAARREGPERDLLLWFGVPLVFLSIASTKRGIYLLPVYPPAAILIAWWLARGTMSAALRAASRLLFGGSIVMAAAAVAALRLARPSDWMTPCALALVVVASGVGAFRALRRDQPGALALSVAGMTAMLELGLIVFLVPAIVNGGTSAKAMGSDLRRMAEAGDRIVYYQVKEGMVGGPDFYAGRTFPILKTPEALADHLGSGGELQGPRPFALLRPAALHEIPPPLRSTLVEARRFSWRGNPWDKSGENDWVLVAHTP